MDALDALYELVKNSLEAGATKIDISLASSDDSLEATVADNGDFIPLDDPFDSSVSTKGPGRGRGLALVREVDRNSTLVREHGITKAHIRWDRRSASLADGLPMIFSLVWDAGAVITLSDGCQVFSSVDFFHMFGDLDMAGALARMKRCFAEYEKRKE